MLFKTINNVFEPSVFSLCEILSSSMQELLKYAPKHPYYYSHTASKMLYFPSQLLLTLSTTISLASSYPLTNQL